MTLKIWNITPRTHTIESRNRIYSILHNRVLNVWLRNIALKDTYSASSKQYIPKAHHLANIYHLNNGKLYFQSSYLLQMCIKYHNTILEMY